jgi:hypothetical protein
MNILGRVGFAGIGLLGFATLIPNIMMGASGIRLANLTANIGCASSYALITSGIMGVLHHRRLFPINYAIKIGIVGIGLQFLTFVVAKNI